LLTYRPETATPLRDLAETLLRGPSSLTPDDPGGYAAMAELIVNAGYVSAVV
jgi:hypothetical protein